MFCCCVRLFDTFLLVACFLSFSWHGIFTPFATRRLRSIVRVGIPTRTDVTRGDSQSAAWSLSLFAFLTNWGRLSSDLLYIRLWFLVYAHCVSFKSRRDDDNNNRYGCEVGVLHPEQRPIGKMGTRAVHRWWRCCWDNLVELDWGSRTVSIGELS